MYFNTFVVKKISKIERSFSIDNFALLTSEYKETVFPILACSLQFDNVPILYCTLENLLNSAHVYIHSAKVFTEVDTCNKSEQ